MIDLPRMQSKEKHTNASEGSVVWSPVKSLWFFSHFVIALVGGVLTFSLSALLVFILFTGITLCLGHSLGMHRKLIHNSYDCPKWMEYLFVHLGVLVGMAGPRGMIYTHDLRDWAQRQANCHAYLKHGRSFLRDAWWQLHCDIKLKNGPEFTPEEDFENDRMYQFMEKSWMLQQLPWALILFVFGGIPWVIWGISLRILVSLVGHWFVGYFAHNQGHRDWHVDGAAVQGHNVAYMAWLTMGESWHNNHHAFPESAVLGIYPNQADPGWWVLRQMYKAGLVTNLKVPDDLAARPELKSLTNKTIYKSPDDKCPLVDWLGAHLRA